MLSNIINLSDGTFELIAMSFPITNKSATPGTADARSECSTSASTSYFFKTFFIFISTIKLLPSPEPQTAIIFIIFTSYNFIF